MNTNIFDSPLPYIKEITQKVRIPQKSKKEFPGKTMAFVFFTKFCDVKCSHCFFRSDSEVFDLPREQYEFSDTCFENFIEFINASNNGYLSILGGGEPFKKFEYIKQTIKRAKTDRIVLVTSGVWASSYEVAKEMIFEMYDALLARQTPTKVVLRLSIDKWHLQKIDISRIFSIIDIYREFFPDKDLFTLQLHTLEKDDSLQKIMDHYAGCSTTKEKKYVSDNSSIFKIGFRRYCLNFSEDYSIPIGVAQMFYSNLKVNLKHPPKNLDILLSIFDDDMKNNSYSNPSLVLNEGNQWGLDFLISYNGNVTTWGNDQLYDLNNLYTDSYEKITNKIYQNVISYSLLDKGYFYRTKVIKEVNPTAVLRSKAINIRDYAGASLLEENHTILYYAIRVIQDYLKEKLLKPEDLLDLPMELLCVILSNKKDSKELYNQSSYSIVQQYRQKDTFNEEEWRDLFHLIYLGHYQVNFEQLYQGIQFYNAHATLQIHDIEEVLENSKEHYTRLNDRLTFMKEEAKALCIANSSIVSEEVTELVSS